MYHNIKKNEQTDRTRCFRQPRTTSKIQTNDTTRGSKSTLLYSQNFYYFGNAFHAFHAFLERILLSEVKIGGNFLRGNSKRFENSVENCRKRGLIKTIRGEWGGVRFSVLFPYLRTGDFPSIERTSVLSSVLCQESEKMETLARGKRENDSNLLENSGGYRER